MARKASTIDKQDVELPPTPPPVPRHIQIPLFRALTLLTLAIFVILAAFGVFGASRGEVAAEGAGLALRVDYPTRIRYKQTDVMRVFVTNTSDRTLPALSVTFDERYLDAFSNVIFTPSASQVWRVDLREVRPGETRRIQIRLQGEHYWQHEGSIVATADGLSSATTEVSTIVYP